MSYSHSFPLLRASRASLPLRPQTSRTARFLRQPYLTLIRNTSQAILPPSPQQASPETLHPKSALDSATSLPPLPYHVERTASQGLPVYYFTKRGGNLHQTRIRKIKGDVVALRDQLRAFLKLKDEHATINPITGQIILKGRYMEEVKQFLERQAF